MLSQKMTANNKLKFAILGVAALILIATPIFALGNKRSELWVNQKASGAHDGSKDHPFKTIWEALDKAKDKAEIHVAKGEYSENIELKDGIKLFGEDKDNTIIKAKKDKWSAVLMKDNSEIDGFTIKDGKRGIWIEKYAKVSIIDCAIKYNDKDGIAIEGGNTNKADAVFISKTEIRKNGQAGIWSTGPRRVIIVDSDILDNGSDGINLAQGTSAWIADNRINNNDGSGMKLAIDRSNIWTRDNSIRENGREGVEVSLFGVAGRIDIAKTKIVDNALHGIAKLNRAVAGSASLWNKYLTIDAKTQFWGNKQGDISRIIFVK
jgi:hypothetical protein